MFSERGRVTRNRLFYIVVEKILGPARALPELPGVAGTTGYDILNQISRVLVNDAGLPVLEDAWQTAAAPGRNFAQMVDEAKSRIIETSLASEFTVLVRLLSRIAAGHWLSRDFTRRSSAGSPQAICATFSGIPHLHVRTASSLNLIERLLIRLSAACREQWVGTDMAILDFLEDVLTLDVLKSGEDRL